LRYIEKENFQMAFLEKAKKQDLVLLAEELGQKIEVFGSNVKRTSCAEDRKKTSSNYRILVSEAEETCVRETSPAVLMAEATIPVTTLSALVLE
ncbi:hypothetical protein TNCV_2911521, partial [Trichonephila clavipes]